MKSPKIVTSSAILLAFLVAFPSAVLAQDGLPGTPGFGFGACLDLEGPHLESAIRIADNYGLDWITIDFDWAKYWPKANNSPNWGTLDSVMHQIGGTNMAVMISITNAPAWALDSGGPNHEWTTDLALRLARRYPDDLLALEIFPAANTTHGWGKTPNPTAYAQLLKTIHNTLTNEGFNNTLIAAGIDPSAGKQEALDFLLALYNAGSALYSPVVSIRLPALSHDPKTNPNEVSDHTLRFYEEARQVMLENGHQNGLIWVTRFDWKQGGLSDTNEQAVWLQNAYLTMRSQLYIGVASFYCLNNAESSTALLSNTGKATPVLDALGGLIAAESNHLTITHIIDLSKSIQKFAQKLRQP
ncbi:MAG: hypothetical protein ISR58_14255 [Anaerolineales bacterium]|nr:hypothetical protein [Chloroflexota bacterium]MBL6982338.1 hypothetical protein [Anaerolineales bacterium]